MFIITVLTSSIPATGIVMWQ